MTSTKTDWSLTSQTSASLEVWMLGVVDYDSALFLQERLVYEISGRTDTLGGLLICEHPPLITVGREGSRADFAVDPEVLRKNRLETRWVNRGGGTVFHAPGQLAVYPIIPLDRMALGVADYRCVLEQAIIDSCADLKVASWPVSAPSGIACRAGRFASIGAAVKRGVSWHGLFLDVSRDMSRVEEIVPRPDGSRQACLASQRTSVNSMHAIRTGLVRHLSSLLGYETFHLYTGHPLLRRTRSTVLDYA